MATVAPRTSWRSAPAVIVAAASADGNSTMYSSGWSVRTNDSPARASVKATQQFWLLTNQVLVPSGVTSSGSSCSSSKYCGGKHEAAVRSAVPAAVNWERRSVGS